MLECTIQYAELFGGGSLQPTEVDIIETLLHVKNLKLRDIKQFVRVQG